MRYLVNPLVTSFQGRWSWISNNIVYKICGCGESQHSTVFSYLSCLTEYQNTQETVLNSKPRKTVFRLFKADYIIIAVHNHWCVMVCNVLQFLTHLSCWISDCLPDSITDCVRVVIQIDTGFLSRVGFAHLYLRVTQISYSRYWSQQPFTFRKEVCLIHVIKQLSNIPAI